MKTESKIEESHEHYRERVFVHTFNGIFWLDTPTFNIEDMAHSLSLCCRFNGHIRHRYSVAQHGLMVADLMEYFGWGDPYEGLLHDGTEFVMSDVPAPFKTRLPDWCGIDKTLETTMRKDFGLPLKKSEGCARADWYALFIEAFYLLNSRGEGFADPYDYRDDAIRIAQGDRRWQPQLEEERYVEQKFLRRFEQLRHRHFMQEAVREAML